MDQDQDDSVRNQHKTSEIRMCLGLLEWFMSFGLDVQNTRIENYASFMLVLNESLGE